MTAFVEPLPLSCVEQGAAGEEARYMLAHWRETGGMMIPDERMARISTKLLLMPAAAQPGDVPQLTFIGRDTTFRRFFPEVEDSSRPVSVLPADYRSRVAVGYQAAIAGEPVFDVQRTGNLLGPGRPDLLMERLILKFRTRAGLERLYCLMMLRELRKPAGQLDRTHRRPSSRQGSGWGPVSLAMTRSTAEHESARA